MLTSIFAGKIKVINFDLAGSPRWLSHPHRRMFRTLILLLPPQGGG